jgi:hypothetical protein
MADVVSLNLPMLRGSTERETCDLNGWQVGDVLEGSDRKGTDRIRITAIGESKLLCCWDYSVNGQYSDEHLTSLSERDWRKIS